MSSEAPQVTNPMVWDWESRRNDILNKIHTYPFVGLVIHEALQNAVDSFFDLDSSEFIHRESPTINITFDLNEGIIQVSDNGTGIDVKNLNGLLKTNFSPKGNLLKNAELRDARRALKGSQGIGIKLTMLCTRKFELRTVYSSSESNMTWRLEFDNWHEKLEKTDDPNVFLPEYPEVTPTTDDVGTILRYQIHPEFMHQQSGQKFSLNHFLLELIRDELVRQNIKLDEDGKLIHVSKENNQLPEFHVTTSVAELVTSSLIHGGTTRYLLDLNHALIEEEDYSSIESKISINEQECEKSKLYIESKKTEPNYLKREIKSAD